MARVVCVIGPEQTGRHRAMEDMGHKDSIEIYEAAGEFILSLDDMYPPQNDLLLELDDGKTVIFRYSSATDVEPSH